jgi:antitoxin CcdA
MEKIMLAPYDQDARKRAVNLSLNADLVRKVRDLGGNLSERVERLLAADLEVQLRSRLEEDARMKEALRAWNEVGEAYGSFADEHSTL